MGIKITLLYYRYFLHLGNMTNFVKSFQLGEVWCEIANELPAEGVRPTTPDQEALETITRAAVERGKGVAMLQAELLEAEEQQDLHDEKQFYAEVVIYFLQI